MDHVIYLKQYAHMSQILIFGQVTHSYIPQKKKNILPDPSSIQTCESSSYRMEKAEQAQDKSQEGSHLSDAYEGVFVFASFDWEGVRVRHMVKSEKERRLFMRVLDGEPERLLHYTQLLAKEEHGKAAVRQRQNGSQKQKEQKVPAGKDRAATATLVARKELAEKDLKQSETKIVSLKDHKQSETESDMAKKADAHAQELVEQEDRAEKKAEHRLNNKVCHECARAALCVCVHVCVQLRFLPLGSRAAAQYLCTSSQNLKARPCTCVYTQQNSTIDVSITHTYDSSTQTSSISSAANLPK